MNYCVSKPKEEGEHSDADTLSVEAVPGPRGRPDGAFGEDPPACRWERTWVPLLWKRPGSSSQSDHQVTRQVHSSVCVQGN